MILKIPKYFFIALSILCGLINSTVFAQRLPIGTKQFDKTDYGAASQNWCASAANNGIIYFANHHGLLVFDGTSWKLNELPNQTILRAVKVVSDSLIFSSGYEELGYWQPDQYGVLQYTSLVDKAERYFSKNQEFWNIAFADSTIYFHSFTRLLSYQNDEISPIVLPGFTSVMNRVRDKILIAVKDIGIFQINGNKAVPLIQEPFFRGKLIRFILPYKDDQLMIGTSSNGIYVWNGENLKEWNPKWTNYFIENDINRGYIAKNGQVIIGSIIDGIIIFDQEGNLAFNLNSKKGLQNNTVLGIDNDPWGNTWVAMDNGIGFISSENKYGYSIEDLGEIGAVYTASVYKGYLYLGTNQGLFGRPLNNPNEKFSLLPGMQNQVWESKVIEGQLLVGHNEGAFRVEGMKATPISQQSGGFSFRKDTKNDSLLFQSTYSSLVIYKKSEDGYQFYKTVDGFYDLIRYIEIDHLGNIWASHMHKGVYQIKLNDNRDTETQTKYFGENIFGKDNGIHVFQMEGRIIFTDSEKIYTYDDLHDTIVPYQTINDQLKEYQSSHRIISAPNHHYWLINDDHIGLFQVIQDSVQLVREYPNSLFTAPPLVDGFENILPLSDKKAILCLQNGIATLDATASNSTFLIEQFTPKLQELTVNNRKNIKHLKLNAKKIRVKHNYQNLQLRFSFPHYTALPIKYQFYMEGLYNDWSENTLDPNFRFDRLPKGNYSLFVKAIDQWGNESQSYQLDIEILPPWYDSPFARMSYIILLIMTILGVRAWGIKQTKKKEQIQHEKRERELIRLRNDKLRNEVEFKSKELANSTMSIIKKNEFLLDLKKTITKQKEELGSRYPDKYFYHLYNKIENNISSLDDWSIFETNFERAHEQFLGKIKKTFPELTSKDLRLCAYLRMNLSSKEIAPLLGISVRGVENHRYRLRKKMNLGHDESLSDLILKI